MNLFVIGWSRKAALPADEPARALGNTLADLPFFSPGDVRNWSAPSGALAAAWVGHGPDRTGGVEYVHAEASRLAFYSGRPILWTGERTADGRKPLEPAFYLDPAESWAGSLDGRFVAATYDEETHTLRVVTDKLGAYPAFATQRDGVTWISNNPDVLRRLSGSDEIDETALACLLGGGWSLSGHPIWSAVRRLPRGTISTYEPGKPARRVELLPTREIVAMLGAGCDPAAAADIVTAAIGALADWPGRPSTVPVTGGRDSRLVFAAALAAGFDFEPVTGGAPGDPDVEIGRRLAGAAGLPHRIPEIGAHGDRAAHPELAARLLMLEAGGTASLADAAGFPLGPSEGPLPIWHSGQGGEIARAYYGLGEGLDLNSLVKKLYAAFVGRRPWRSEVVSRRGRALIEAELGKWVTAQLDAGADPTDVPDLFYLERRMGTWAGPTHACVEWVRDTSSPLWSHRLLPQMLGLPAHERARELFHLRLLERLAPNLIDVLPFADGHRWRLKPGRVRERLERAGKLARKARGALRRRLERTANSRVPTTSPPPPDPIAPIVDLVRRGLDEPEDGPLGDLLDRDRVNQLLAADPRTLDEMSRYYVWRLATVSLAARGQRRPGMEARPRPTTQRA